MACKYDPDVLEFDYDDRQEPYIPEDDEDLSSWSLAEAGFDVNTFDAPF